MEHSFTVYRTWMDGDSAGRATCYGLTARGSNPGVGGTFCTVHTGPEVHQTSCTIGTGPLFWGVKRPERGVDHPLLLSPRLKKEYSPSGPSWHVVG